MSIIVQLSDTHFGTEVPAVMQAVKQSMLEIKPDVIILSGDITQRARPSQFKAAAAFLEALPAQIKFAIPGNHDIPLFNIPARIFNPYGEYLKAFKSRGGFWQHDNVGIIGFDATSRWRHTRGKLLEKDLIERIEQARRQLKEDAVLIACAHQPLLTAWPEDVENILVNAQRAAEIFAGHGVDIVLSGHVHVPIITTTKTAFPRLLRHFILCGAGTAISCRIRPGAPNSFNIIEVKHGIGIAVRLMEYNAVPGQFAEKERKEFTLGQEGWRYRI